MRAGHHSPLPVRSPTGARVNHCASRRGAPLLSGGRPTGSPLSTTEARRTVENQAAPLVFAKYGVLLVDLQGMEDFQQAVDLLGCPGADADAVI